jgi:hypothetical protein
VEYCFINSKGYLGSLGCDDAVCGLDSSAWNVETLRVDHLHVHRPRLKGTWYLDTLIAKVKSLLGNKCANVLTNGKYTKVVPMASEKEAAESLIDFMDDTGIPRHW